MIIKDSISENYPIVNHNESPLRAFDLMKEYQVSCLPVLITETNEYVGLISEIDTLNDIGVSTVIELLSKDKSYAVFTDDSILQGLRLIESADLPIVPVINSKHKYVGSCKKNNLLIALEKSFHIQEIGTVLLILAERKAFAMSHLTRIIEEESAVVMTCTSTEVKDEESLVRICVKLQSIESSKVISALRRHGYVIESISDSNFDEEYSDKADAFLHYLSI